MGVNSMPETYLTALRLQFEPGPFCAKVQHANHSATEPPSDILGVKNSDILRDGFSSAGWAMLSLHTKFEIPGFSHYEDMKGDVTCRTGVVQGGYGVNQANRQRHHSTDSVQLICL